VRLAFADFGLLVVGVHGGRWASYLVAALAWTGVTFALHLLAVRAQHRYDAATNLALLGIFLLGMTYIGLWGIK